MKIVSLLELTEQLVLLFYEILEQRYDEVYGWENKGTTLNDWFNLFSSGRGVYHLRYELCVEVEKNLKYLVLKAKAQRHGYEIDLRKAGDEYCLIIREKK